MPTVLSGKSSVYRALLTQSSTSAPSATILESNIVGTIVWARTGTGVYTATLTGAFTASKTFCWATLTTAADAGGTIYFTRTSSDALTLKTYDHSFAAVDAALTAAPVEIRVYS